DRNRGRGARLPNLWRTGGRLERGAHGGDVGRRGAAAAADVGDPEVGRLPGEGREVFGGREVEEAPFDPRRESGVGLAGQGQLGLMPHRLEYLERDLGADPAVDADDVDAGPLQRLDHLAGFL